MKYKMICKLSYQSFGFIFDLCQGRESPRSLSIEVESTFMVRSSVSSAYISCFIIFFSCLTNPNPYCKIYCLSTFDISRRCQCTTIYIFHYHNIIIHPHFYFRRQLSIVSFELFKCLN